MGAQQLCRLVRMAIRSAGMTTDVDNQSIEAGGIGLPLPSAHGSQKRVQSEFVVLERPQLKDTDLRAILSLHKESGGGVEIVVDLNRRSVARQPGYSIAPVASEIVPNK
jgi:hypothetical protein